MGRKVYHNLTAIIKDKKGNIISIGKNSYFKTHPMMYKLNKELGIHEPVKVYIHAEIDALIRCFDLSKAHSIEIFRVSKNKYRCSKPCALCLRAISKTNIKIIRYININGELEEELL